MESPSGRACDVIRNRCRAAIALQISATTDSVAVRVVVPGVAMRRRALRLQLLEDLLDPIVPRDRVVVEELQLRHAPEPQPPPELPPQERGGALERALALAPRLVVAERREVHAGDLQVGR